jgi:hypothetical protein
MLVKPATESPSGPSRVAAPQFMMQKSYFRGHNNLLQLSYICLGLELHRKLWSGLADDSCLLIDGERCPQM